MGWGAVILRGNRVQWGHYGCNRPHRLCVLVVSEQDGAPVRVEADLGGHEVDGVSRHTGRRVLRHKHLLVDLVDEHVLPGKRGKGYSSVGRERARYLWILSIRANTARKRQGLRLHHLHAVRIAQKSYL